MKSPDQAAFKVILVVAVLIAIAVLPFVARAQPGGPPPPPSFEEFDTDGDGFVSEEEFTTVRNERIAARVKEGRRMQGLSAASDFADIDTDGDGRLDNSEFSAEMNRHMQAVHGQQGGRGYGYGMQGRGKGQGMHGKGMNMPTFGDLDLDGNGCIDAAEFTQHQAEFHGMGRGQKAGAQAEQLENEEP
jgi:hypothetical protein